MIDTDKYEGHAPASWRAVYVEKDGTETFMLAQSGPDRKWLPMKNCHLAADAPLLLAEVKRLSKVNNDLQHDLESFQEVAAEDEAALKDTVAALEAEVERLRELVGS